MKQQPLVSVIMNGHNAAQYLHEAIASVLSQTYSNWEIVFFDNASTDITKKIVQSYHDARIHYFYSDEFLALGAARNRAMQHATGDFIAFLDCDDLWMPTKLSQQITLFDDPQVGMVYSDAIYFNNQGDCAAVLKKCNPYRGWCFKELVLNYFLSMQTVVIRRVALDQLDQWFDPRFNMIEDYDFFVRIARLWKLDYSSDVLAKWRVHSNSLTWSKQHLFIEERKLLLQSWFQDIDFMEQYSSLLSQMMRQLNIAEARLLWSQGDGMKARQLLFRSKQWHLKVYIIWILSFLPFVKVDMVYSFLTHSIRPK